MLTETYRGRKLRVRKGREWGTLDATVNGVATLTLTGCDEAAVLTQLRADIDWIDREPVNGDRWGAEWYAPGTYTLCVKGLHPVALDGECEHFTCKRERRAS